MEKLEKRAFELADVEVRAASDGEPAKISGYAVEWDKLSNPIFGFQEKFQRGAFTNLSGDIRALWQHDPSLVLGRTTNKTLTLYEDDRGLRCEIIPPTSTWATDAVESIRRGDVSEMSFMFRASKDQWDDSDPSMAIRTVLSAELYEVSPVTFAAYPQTSVGVRSAQEVFESYTEQRRAAGNEDGKAKIAIRHKKLDLISKL